MKYLISDTKALGGFTSVETTEDGYLCDGVTIPSSVVGEVVIADYSLSDKPDFDVYLETVVEGNPIKINETLYQQTWSITPLTGDALTAAQAQKAEDKKAKIKADIATLELTITPRRTREAILGTDGGWLADIELQIEALRTLLIE